jgi:hypothetical protein
MGDRIINGSQSRWRLFARLSLPIPLSLFIFFCPPFFGLVLSNVCMAADSSLLTIKNAEIGFGGRYRSGHWTPVTLTLFANKTPVAGQLQLIAPDGDNVPVVFFASDDDYSFCRIQLDAGKEVTLHSYVKAGPQKSRLSARLVDPGSGRVLWQSRLLESTSSPLSATTPLVVTIGKSVGVEDALKFTRRNEAGALVAAEATSAINLPSHVWGYEGVEIIVLPTGSAGFVNQLSPEQTAALLHWVREGGRLVISAGSKIEQLFADHSPWRSIIPGQFAEVVPMRDAATLESLSGEAFPFTDDASRPPVVHLKAVRGKVELTQGPGAAETPLVIRAPHGFGEVTFVAFDLEGERFAKWAGRPRFVAGLLHERKSAEREQPGGTAGARLGYSDLAGQLRAALDQFPGVHVVNFTTVAILMMTYIVLIGPADYLFSQRLGIPRSITWITFPLVALLFCGIAWFFAGWSHGNRLRLNQAEIIDIDAERGQVRGTAWLHLYSPETKTYDLSIQLAAAAQAKPVTKAGHVTWQGLPGSGLGGLDAQQVAPAISDPYAIEFPAATPALRGLPIQVGSSKSLSVRWWQEVSLPETSKVSLNEHGVPTGDVVNPLDVELQECIFTYNIWMYRLKKLRAGERFSLGDARPLYLEARLQQHTGAEFKDTATPWLRDSTAVPAILQMLMYHEAARGESYTGLTHRYQPHLDLSGQLTRGQGMLVGRAEQAASSLHVAGSPLPADQIQSWTYYRIVIPVGERGASAP